MPYAFLMRMLASLLRGELHVARRARRLFYLFLTAIRRICGLTRHASPPSETNTNALKKNTLASLYTGTHCHNGDETPSIASLPRVMRSSLPRSQAINDCSPLRLEEGTQNDTPGCLSIESSDVEPRSPSAAVEKDLSRSPSPFPTTRPKPSLVSQTLIPILPTQSDRLKRDYPMCV